MNRINVLQIGNEDLSLTLQIPEYINWHYINDLKNANEKSYEICILNRNVTEKEIDIIIKKIRAYTLFVLDTFPMNSFTERLYQSRVGKKLPFDSLQQFIKHEACFFFASSYGEKLDYRQLCISQFFKGSVYWQGYNGVELNGNYGDTFSQIAYWRINIPVFKGQSIDFWLEYEKENEVSLCLKIEQFQSGSVSTLQNRWLFNEQELSSIVSITNDKMDGPVFVSVMAKGKGKLKIVALHDRYSRKKYGNFIPGGIRFVTQKREEIFVYFDPADMKPPLNVYFSGFKTKEGFEGLNMMRKLGSPFVLISESRLEGGAFYLGDEEYENFILLAIQDCLNQLGFNHSQLNLSGLSMGTFGALYYGCKLHPHAILLGKPLASLGDMALAERIQRPGGFPTSLDVLLKNYGEMTEYAATQLNDRFWNQFYNVNWEDTKFIISYMLEDDYDSSAYDKILSAIHQTKVEIFGKGIHGRHNDNTYDIVSWFVNQYKKILTEDFNRCGE